MVKILCAAVMVMFSFAAKGETDNLKSTAFAIAEIEKDTGIELHKKYVDGSLQASFDGKIFLSGPELAMMYYAIDATYPRTNLVALFRPVAIERKGLVGFDSDGVSKIKTAKLDIHISKSGAALHIDTAPMGRGDTNFSMDIELKPSSDHMDEAGPPATNRRAE